MKMDNIGFALAASVVMAATSLFAAPAVYQTAVNNTAGLYASYNFNETGGTSAAANNSAYNGTYTNSGITYGVAGANGGDTAVTTNGSSSYIRLGNDLSFGSSIATSSYEFVFKTNSTASTYLFGAGNGISGTYPTAIQFGLNMTKNSASATGSTRIYIRDESGYSLDWSFTVADAGGISLYDGNYHHLAITFQANATTLAETLKIYIDGQQITLSTSSDKLLIGSSSDASKKNVFADFQTYGGSQVSGPLIGALNGKGWPSGYSVVTIDEAALYTDILSAQQVAEHYTALTSVPEPATLGLAGFAGSLLLMRSKKN